MTSDTHPNYDPKTRCFFGVIKAMAILPDIMANIFMEGVDNNTFKATVAAKQLEIERAVDMGEDVDEGLRAVLDFVPKSDVDATIDEILGETTPEARWECVAEYFSERYDGSDVDWVWRDKDYVITSCLPGTIAVAKSPYYTFAPRCSPCVPNAGNLSDAADLHTAKTFQCGNCQELVKVSGGDEPASNKHCVKPQETGIHRHRWFEVRDVQPLDAVSEVEYHGVKTYCLGHSFFGKEAPYPVLSVATNKMVIWKETKTDCSQCGGDGRDTVQRLAKARGITDLECIKAIKSGEIYLRDYTPEVETFRCMRCDGNGFASTFAEVESE